MDNRDRELLVLGADDVTALLAGREHDVLHTVQRAYEIHALGESALPHSSFLRFPANERDRIIALPAFLGHEFDVAGIKWIASFPGNHERGIDRASATIILNSAHNGRPEALIEGSTISAMRTAASAALAARALHGYAETTSAGIIGCGPISRQIAHFLRVVFPDLRRFVVYDLKRESAERWRRAQLDQPGVVAVDVAPDIESVLRSSPLIALATTAVEPHIADLTTCAPGTTILHISLRDIAPEVMLRCDNIVDDVEHVCRAQTSVHLAEQLSGSRAFIRCTLADILSGSAPARRDEQSITVFSPFGLGVLDLGVASMVRGLARERGCGITVPAFLP